MRIPIASSIALADTDAVTSRPSNARLEIRIGEAPVREVREEGLHIALARVLVVEIVRVLPYVHAEKRDAPDQQRTLGILHGLDGHAFLLGVEREPDVARAEEADCASDELLLEGRERAEAPDDRLVDSP